MVEKKSETKKELTEISWRAAEYHYVQKDVLWYWFLGIGAAVLVIISLFQKNFFFAVFIILAAVTAGFFWKQKPPILDFKINDKGIAIGDKIFYDYERLDGFTIVNRPPRLDEIILKKKTTINPYIRIPVDSHLAVGVKNLLANNLQEIEYNESLIDIIADRFGF